MQRYADFEASQLAALRNQERKAADCVSCPTCGGQWFEEVQAFRFQADHNLVVGQHVPPKSGSVAYMLLRCLNEECKNVLEPMVQMNARDIAGDAYDNFLDTIEGKLDKRMETRGPTGGNGEISSEEL